MSLRDEYADKKAVGVYGMGNWGGLEVLDIIYDTEDYVVSCFDFGNGRKNFSKSKIQYTRPRREDAESRAYFIKLDRRYYLDEIMRADYPSI